VHLDTGVRRLALIAVAGLVTGVLTQLGQGALPDGWRQVANAISPYVATLPALGLGAAGYIVFVMLYGVITGV
jgi:hypothetical protein